jgi:hypothetical protein
MTGRVIAGEHDDRVGGDPGLVNTVDDLPDSVVPFGHEVRVQAQPGWIGLIQIGVRLLEIEGMVPWRRALASGLGTIKQATQTALQSNQD